MGWDGEDYVLRLGDDVIGRWKVYVTAANKRE
jgi:hypothetical protein